MILDCFSEFEITIVPKIYIIKRTQLFCLAKGVLDLVIVNFFFNPGWMKEQKGKTV